MKKGVEQNGKTGQRITLEGAAFIFVELQA